MPKVPNLKKDHRTRRPQVGTGPARKTLWDTTLEPNLEIIEGWARRAYTEASMCKALGISTVTFWNEKKKHPELQAAIDKGKRDATVLVENALFREAIGYEAVETRRTIVGYDEAGEEIVSEEIVTNKWIRPNFAAQALYLMNREPDRWKHTRTLKVEGGEKPLQVQGFDVSRLPLDQLEQLETLLSQALVEDPGEPLSLLPAPPIQEAEEVEEDDDLSDFDWPEAEDPADE